MIPVCENRLDLELPCVDQRAAPVFHFPDDVEDIDICSQWNNRSQILHSDSCLRANRFSAHIRPELTENWCTVVNVIGCLVIPSLGITLKLTAVYHHATW